jgi:hypothetical protein
MREDRARSDLTPPFLVSTIWVGRKTYAAHFPQRNRRFKHHKLIAITSLRAGCALDYLVCLLTSMSAAGLLAPERELNGRGILQVLVFLADASAYIVRVRQKDHRSQLTCQSMATVIIVRSVQHNARVDSVRKPNLYHVWTLPRATTQLK